LVPEAADVSWLAGLVFSKYCKIVFSSSTVVTGKSQN